MLLGLYHWFISKNERYEYEFYQEQVNNDVRYIDKFSKTKKFIICSSRDGIDVA